MKRFSVNIHPRTHGLRQVDISSTIDQENRRLTTLRKHAGRARTRLINQIKHILRRHNLQWEMPTKTFPTQPAIAWLKKLVLPGRGGTDGRPCPDMILLLEQELHGFPTTIRQAAAPLMWQLWVSHPNSVKPNSWVPSALQYYERVAA